MEINRYLLEGRGWTAAKEHASSPDGKRTIWEETCYVGAPEVEVLAARFGAEPDVLDYFVRTDASFISYVSDANFLLATRTARFDGVGLEFESLIIAVAEGKFVTVESANSAIGRATRENWESNSPKGVSGPWPVLANFLDEFADSYRPAIESIEDSVLLMEENLAKAPLDKRQLTVLFRTRRQLILLQRVIDPISDLIAHWNTRDGAYDGETPDFRGAYEELLRLDRRVDGLWKVVTSVFEMSNLLEQQRQGLASRKLTAWAGIVAAPTALAGIFGMNFTGLPLLEAENGHWIALAMMAGVSFALFLRFWRIGWL